VRRAGQCKNPGDGCHRPGVVTDREGVDVVHDTRRRALQAKIEAQPSGCWIWTGVINRYGYGVHARSRERMAAHRYAYLLLVGPIPTDGHIDHVCHTRVRDQCTDPARCMHRRCVNPAHLQVVENRTNVIEGNSPAGLNARKRHCDSGHEFSPANTRISPQGHRVCKECKRIANALWRARRKRAA